MRLLANHPGGIEALALAGDGTPITAGRDGRVIAWRAAPEVLLTREPRVRTLAIDGDTLIAGTLDGHVLRVRGGVVDEPYGVFADGHAGVGSVALQGERVVIGAGLTQLAAHHVDGARLFHGSTYKWPYVVRIDKNKIACGTWQPDLHVIDLAEPPSGDLYGGFDGPGPIFDAAFLPDGRVVAVGATEEGGFLALDERIVTTEDGLHAVVALDDRLAVGGNDQAVRFYDLELEVLETMTLGEPWKDRFAAELPSHAPFHAASGPRAVIALVRSANRVVCATVGGEVFELP